MSTRRSAFSILEVVVVVAVGALLAGIAVPRMGGATTRYRADYAARQVAADLERARATARLTGVPQSVQFDLLQHQYTVSGTGSGSTAATVVRLAGEPYTARLTGASFAGAVAVTFTPYGDPVPAGPTAVAGTVTLRVGDLTRTVTLDAGSGRARWQ